MDMLTQADTERRLIAVTDALDTQTELFAVIAEQRAEAEAAYKFLQARALVEQAGKVPVATKEAVAHLRGIAEFREWKVLEARERATQQKLMALRAQLEALRTIAANVRVLTR
jgi:hypothetical protein